MLNYEGSARNATGHRECTEGHSPGSGQRFSSRGSRRWVWDTGCTPGQPARGEPTGGDISRVAEVAPQDIPAALETIEGTPQDLARFKAQDACKARLAWVTILHAPGQPTGRIRLQSGHYFSPAFTLTDVPVRVALPFPAPYPIGRGTITVLGTTTDAIVALTPPWHVPAQGTVHAQGRNVDASQRLPKRQDLVGSGMKRLAGKLAFIHRTLWQRDHAYRWAMLLGAAASRRLRARGVRPGGLAASSQHGTRPESRRAMGPLDPACAAR